MSTISDHKDNVHWFKAVSETAYIFNVHVIGYDPDIKGNSGRLYVDPARGAVLMREPRVERFAIDGVDEARQRQFGKVANVLMNKAIGDVPVYNFRMEDLRYAGVQFVPTRITSTADALVVTVEPAR